ncbi:hypothetical protein CANCADRAFT_99630 [Tortispora caseinolytica NRRL Y-17796]|uniref:Uncharacterized protein n=1 Tax=Tortispora caseinolytica NRRL Y-17796 TaxID=767744 RepID=A0A1E4TE38_9ASCO|nr:hypothetical protein CANCADRAFT_99630 [Tortispora caseinolytica NRRL Y-17796]
MSETTLHVPDLTLTPAREFHPRNTRSDTSKMFGLSTFVGLMVASLENSMSKTRTGPLGVFTTYGGSIGYFAALGTSFQFVSSCSANLREKEDGWNETIGGAAAGCVVAFKRRTVGALFGYPLLFATTIGLLQWTGGKLSMGERAPMYAPDSVLDTKYEKQGFWEIVHRRPLSQTISELGEGRGISAKLE